MREKKRGGEAFSCEDLEDWKIPLCMTSEILLLGVREGNDLIERGHQ